jgi:hypothetical protein
MVVETLIAAGFKRVYGVVGNSLNGILKCGAWTLSIGYRYYRLGDTTTQFRGPALLPECH